MDVWLAQWGLHGAAALDLAVTSGLRAGAVLTASASSGSAAVEAYEARKRAPLDTERLCQAEGLQFLPLIAEACGGGWGPTAAVVWRALGGLIAGRSGDSPTAETDRLLQSLAIALHRENARAVLRRLPSGLEDASPFAEPCASYTPFCRGPPPGSLRPSMCSRPSLSLQSPNAL